MTRLWIAYAVATLLTLAAVGPARAGKVGGFRAGGGMKGGFHPRMKGGFHPAMSKGGFHPLMSQWSFHPAMRKGGFPPPGGKGGPWRK